MRPVVLLSFLHLPDVIIDADIAVICDKVTGKMLYKLSPIFIKYYKPEDFY